MTSLADLHREAAARGLAGYRRLSRTELEQALGDGAAPAPPEPEPRDAETPPEAPAAPPATAAARVRVDRDGPLALLTLDDPATRNAVGPALLESLDAALAGLEGDATVRLVALTGAGGVFSSGAAIHEYEALPDGGAVLTDRACAVIDRLAALPVPVVALVNGHAVGGGAELALAADWRLVAPTAELRFVHAGFGLVPGFGGLARLARLVGPDEALRLLATRAVLDGPQAVEAGLALAAVPAGRLVDRARSLAAAIAESDRDAVAVLKAALAGPSVTRRDERAAFLASWPRRRIPSNLRR